jgi:hypothetical protein
VVFMEGFRIFFFVVLGIEPKSLYLAHSLPLEPHPLFALVIFEIGSLFMSGLAWTPVFLFVLFCVTGMTGAYHHAQLFPLRWGSQKLFCLG